MSAYVIVYNVIRRQGIDSQLMLKASYSELGAKALAEIAACEELEDPRFKAQWFESRTGIPMFFLDDQSRISYVVHKVEIID